MIKLTYFIYYAIEVPLILIHLPASLEKIFGFLFAPPSSKVTLTQSFPGGETNTANTFPPMLPLFVTQKYASPKGNSELSHAKLSYPSLSFTIDQLPVTSAHSFASSLEIAAKSTFGISGFAAIIPNGFGSPLLDL